MRNYLQRIALSAIQPGGDVWPRINPLHGAPKDDSSTAVPSLDEHFVGAGQQDTCLPAKPTSNSNVTPAKITIPPVSPPKLTDRLLPQEPVRHAGRSLEATTDLEVLDLPDTPTNVPVAAASNHADLQRLDPHPGKMARESQAQIPSPSHRSPVELSSQLAGTETSRSNALPIPRANGWGKNQRTNDERRREQPMREPDEIEIHIGRIEVTAVGAMQPAAPVKKPRKTAPSLDEYLRRRERP